MIKVVPSLSVDNSPDSATTASADITDATATATTHLNEEASSSKQGELSPPPGAPDLKNVIKAELQNLTDQQP